MKELKLLKKELTLTSSIINKNNRRFISQSQEEGSTYKQLIVTKTDTFSPIKFWVRNETEFIQIAQINNNRLETWNSATNGWVVRNNEQISNLPQHASITSTGENIEDFVVLLKWTNIYRFDGRIVSLFNGEGYRYAVITKLGYWQTLEFSPITGDVIYTVNPSPVLNEEHEGRFSTGGTVTETETSSTCNVTATLYKERSWSIVKSQQHGESFPIYDNPVDDGSLVFMGTFTYEYEEYITFQNNILNISGFWFREFRDMNGNVTSYTFDEPIDYYFSEFDGGYPVRDPATNRYNYGLQSIEDENDKLSYSGYIDRFGQIVIYADDPLSETFGWGSYSINKSYEIDPTNPNNIPYGTATAQYSITGFNQLTTIGSRTFKGRYFNYIPILFSDNTYNSEIILNDSDVIVASMNVKDYTTEISNGNNISVNITGSSNSRAVEIENNILIGRSNQDFGTANRCIVRKPNYDYQIFENNNPISITYTEEEARKIATFGSFVDDISIGTTTSDKNIIKIQRGSFINPVGSFSEFTVPFVPIPESDAMELIPDTTLDSETSVFITPYQWIAIGFDFGAEKPPIPTSELPTDPIGGGGGNGAN